MRSSCKSYGTVGISITFILAGGAGTSANCLPFPFNGDLLQVMPWPTYANMTDRDLLAIYTYLSSIPCNPEPSGLDPALYEQNVCE